MKRLFERLKAQNTRIGVHFSSASRDSDIVNAEIKEFDNEYVTLLDGNNISLAVEYRNIAYVTYRENDFSLLTRDEILSRKAVLLEELKRIDAVLE